MRFADVGPVPEPDRARILCFKTILLGNLLTLTPAVLFFGGVGLVAWDLSPMLFGEEPRGEGAITLVTGGLLTALGVVGAIVGALWAFRNTTWLGNVYLKWYAKGVIRSRLEPLVNPDDPDAVFVEIVPKENWQRMMLETATDVGFLKVSEDTQEVLYEGGVERFRVPGSALISCRSAMAFVGPGTDSDVEYYFVVIKARTPDRNWSVSFAPRGDFGSWGGKTRRKRSQALCERINRLDSAELVELVEEDD